MTAPASTRSSVRPWSRMAASMSRHSRMRCACTAIADSEAELERAEIRARDGVAHEAREHVEHRRGPNSERHDQYGERARRPCFGRSEIGKFSAERLEHGASPPLLRHRPEKRARHPTE